MGNFLSPYPDWICQLIFPVRLKGLFHCHLVSDDANVHLMPVWLSFIRKLSVLSVRGLCFLYACVLKRYAVLDDGWSSGYLTGLFSLKVHIISSWSFFFYYFLSSVFSRSEMLLKWMWPFCVNPYCLLIKFFSSVLLYFLCFPWLLALVLLIFSPINQNFHFPEFLISDCTFFVAAFQISLKCYVNILSTCLLFPESSSLFLGSPFFVLPFGDADFLFN